MPEIPATTSLVASHLGYRVETTCAINVTDSSRAKKWYAEVLGFEMLYEVPDIGWSEWRTNVPGLALGLSEIQDMPPPGGGATLTFGITDIEHARAWLEGKGVRFDGETREIPGLVKLATFFDPDGNTFMLAEGLQQQTASI